VRQKLIRLSTELGRLWLKCKDFFCATTKWKIEMDYLHHTSFGIGVLGVLVIVFGVLNGLLKFVRAEFSAARGLLVDEERKKLRHVLGYYLLLGLEFLIAADIIDTLMKPRVQDLAVLGAIVLIRTMISYSLNAELKSERQPTPTPP
jgi:uncharacterized membrane protein